MVGISLTVSSQDAYLYKKYAEKGDEEAIYNLANFYMYGNGGLEQDYSKAVFWLTKAAKKNTHLQRYLSLTATSME